MAGGARVSDFFSNKCKSKKKKFFLEGGEGRGRWVDSRTGPNQFVPSTSSKLGA